MAAAVQTPPQALIAEGLEVDAQELAQQRLAVVGASGSGKTYAVGRIIEQLSAGNVPVIVLDTVGVWPMLRLAANGKPPGLPFTIVGGDHQDVPLHWGKGAALASFLYEHRTSAVIDLSDGISQVRAPFVAAFCAQLLVLVKRRRRPLTVVFDEGPDLLPQTVRKGELAMLQNVSELIRKGRNHACGTIITSQRPQDVAKGPLDQAGTMLVGALYGSHERKALADWVGRKTRGSAVREQLDRLSELAPGQFFLWSPGWLKEYREIRVLQKWTYDGSSLSTRLEADAELGELSASDVSDLRALLTEPATAEEERSLPTPTKDPKGAPRSMRADAEEIASRLVKRLEAVEKEMTVLGAKYAALRQASDRREAALVKWRNSMPSGPLFELPTAKIEGTPPAAAARARSPEPAQVTGQAACPVHREAPARTQRARSEVSNAEGDLSQRALAAIAVYGPLSFFEVALYARSSIKSGALVRALRAAVVDGVLAHEAGQYRALAAPGRQFVAEWQRGEALREAWESTLSEAQRKAWDAMLTAPPAGYSQAELCTVAAVSQKSGAFVRALRALKGWNLLEGGKRNWKIPEMTRKAFGLDRVVRGKGSA